MERQREEKEILGASQQDVVDQFGDGLEGGCEITNWRIASFGVLFFLLCVLAGAIGYDLGYFFG